jgi:hypothetical protein
MLIALVNDGAVIKVADYRTIFPNTSFAKGPTKQFLLDNSCLPVDAFLPHDKATEKLVGCDPYIDGDVVRTVKVEAKTQADIDADTASIAAKARKQRDTLLAQSDWRVVKQAETGTPMAAEWVSYRQALRDITEQAGFPRDIIWPVNPDAPVTEEDII